MERQTALEKYIYDEIVPRYASFDSAHREDHALTVISQAMKLLDKMEVWKTTQKEPAQDWAVEVDRRMLLTAAACHDLGLANGRDRHHIDSGIIIRSDSRLREWFTEEQIEIIACAAEDHRASGTAEPRSIYGKLVAEADRLIDGETIIRRTIQFGFKHYPGLSSDEHIRRAIEHLHEKYGRGGYLKLWIPWSDNAKNLARLQDLIDDDKSLLDEVRRIFSKLSS